VNGIKWMNLFMGGLWLAGKNPVTIAICHNSPILSVQSLVSSASYKPSVE
jgi:hypothetical protein